MNTRTVSCLAIFTAMAMIVPEIQAQRSGGRGQRPEGQAQRSEGQAQRSEGQAQRPEITVRATPPPSHNPTNLPTSPILPMRNPVAPMTTAPVQPFIR